MRVAILSACSLATLAILTSDFASANPLGLGWPSMTAAQDPRLSSDRFMMEVGFRGGYGGGGFDRGGFHNDVVVNRNVNVGGYRGGYGYGWGGAAVGGAVAGAAVGTAVGAAASTAYATDPYPYGYPYPAY